LFEVLVLLARLGRRDVEAFAVPVEPVRRHLRPAVFADGGDHDVPRLGQELLQLLTRHAGAGVGHLGLLGACHRLHTREVRNGRVSGQASEQWCTARREAESLA
jgi:hypothetical protein